MQTKKEMKDAYRQMKFRIGVFQVRNTESGKIFIDSSPNLDAIWNRLRMQLNNGMHPNVQLQADWKNIGADKFAFETLAEIEQKDEDAKDYTKEAKDLAALYIDELKPFDEKEYNKKPK
jgi:hypothetical protein